MVSCFGFSGIFVGLAVSGSATSTPFCSIGVTTMKMIRQHQADVDEGSDVDVAPDLADELELVVLRQHACSSAAS